jgi:hypothetical protein
VNFLTTRPATALSRLTSVDGAARIVWVCPANCCAKFGVVIGTVTGRFHRFRVATNGPALSARPFPIAEETMTMNCVLLTGAGFSKNWGGRLAREVTNDLMSRLQGNQHLLQLLNRANFEDVSCSGAG